MKQVLRIGMVAGMMALGIQSQAEAVTQLSVVICQGGLLCQNFGPVAGPGPISNPNINVGDYQISGSVSSSEDALGSNSATTAISVKRLTANNAGNLQIWATASNYNLPVGTTYNFTETLTATSSLAPAGSTVTYMGWLLNGNVAPFVSAPPGGSTPGVISCALGFPTDNCTSPEASSVANIGTPFSIVTLTTFNVATPGSAATYTSGGQANVTATAVPEPASMLLLGTGLVGIARFGRRRFNKASR